MGQLLGFAGTVIAALLALGGLLYLDRRRRSEATLTRREERQRMETKEKADRADLVLDSYEALVKRVENESVTTRRELDEVRRRLDECMVERLEWREQRLELERELAKVKQRLDRAASGLTDGTDEDTPPPTS